MFLPGGTGGRLMAVSNVNEYLFQDLFDTIRAPTFVKQLAMQLCDLQETQQPITVSASSPTVYFDPCRSSTPGTQPPRLIATRRGGAIGVSDDWKQASVHITGHRGVEFKRFSSRSEAEVWVDSGANNGHTYKRVYILMFVSSRYVF